MLLLSENDSKTILKPTSDVPQFISMDKKNASAHLWYLFLYLDKSVWRNREEERLSHTPQTFPSNELLYPCHNLISVTISLHSEYTVSFLKSINFAAHLLS